MDASTHNQFEWFTCNEAGGGLPSEDRVHVREADGHLFAWVIDGASPVDPRLVTSTGQTGGAWHAEQLGAALDRFVQPDQTLHAILAHAVATVASAFERENARLRWPRWAFPLSALSLVHLWRADDGQVTGRGLHLADCPMFRVGPQVQVLHEHLQPDESRVRSAASGHVAAAIDLLKVRRMAQHDDPAPDVAGLNPACATQARVTTFTLDPGERLVILTDGFARIWDEYALDARDDVLCDLTSRDRALARIAAMREHERTTYLSALDRMLKSSDDASLASIGLSAD